MMNIAKCIVQLLALLLLGLRDIFNPNNNNVNDDRVPLIVNPYDMNDEGGLNVSQINQIKKIKYLKEKQTADTCPICCAQFT